MFLLFGLFLLLSYLATHVEAWSCDEVVAEEVLSVA